MVTVIVTGKAYGALSPRRLKSVEAPGDSQSESFCYGSAGAALADPPTGLRFRGYPLRGRTQSPVSDPAGDYDNDLARTITQNGATTTFALDPLDRRTTESVVSASGARQIYSSLLGLDRSPIMGHRCDDDSLQRSDWGGPHDNDSDHSRPGRYPPSVRPASGADRSAPINPAEGETQ